MSPFVNWGASNTAPGRDNGSRPLPFGKYYAFTIRTRRKRVKNERRWVRLELQVAQDVGRWLVGNIVRRSLSQIGDSIRQHHEGSPIAPRNRDWFRPDDSPSDNAGANLHMQEETMSDEQTNGFTAEERAAMKERAKEVKAGSRKGKKANGEKDVLDKIAEMPESDRAMAERIHEIVKASAPELSPKTWYGMPAYAKDGKVVCFFQSADKFKARYATFGFNDTANLDDGTMWPTSFALTELTDAAATRIAELVKKAVS